LERAEEKQMETVRWTFGEKSWVAKLDSSLIELDLMRGAEGSPEVLGP
jgi:hypothetical protein